VVPIIRPRRNPFDLAKPVSGYCLLVSQNHRLPHWVFRGSTPSAIAFGLLAPLPTLKETGRPIPSKAEYRWLAKPSRTGFTPAVCLSDLCSAALTGTTFERDAEQLGTQVKLYEDDNQTLIELLNGRIDGVLTDRIVGLNAIAELKEGDRLTLVGSVLRSEVMAIAFHKDNTELKNQVNDILSSMFADGTMKAISEKWFGGEDITVE